MSESNLGQFDSNKDIFEQFGLKRPKELSDEIYNFEFKISGDPRDGLLFDTDIFKNLYSNAWEYKELGGSEYSRFYSIPMPEQLRNNIDEYYALLLKTGGNEFIASNAFSGTAEQFVYIRSNVNKLFEQTYFGGTSLNEIVRLNEDVYGKQIKTYMETGEIEEIDISSLIREEPQKVLPLQEPEVKTLFSFNTESAQLQNSYTNVALKKDNAFVTGFIKDDSMFVLAHGTKAGGIIAANDYGISSEFLSSILQEEGLIPENVKNIYTMSCYGGLQEPFEMPNGIKVQPLHTSNEKIKFGLHQGENGVSLMLGVTDDSDLSLSFKEKFKTQSGDSLDVDLAFTSEDFNKAFIDNKARHGALTAQEAFDKYGPDDDRFFTSQGLDPAEQRAKLEKINKHSEPEPGITEEVMESVELESEIDTPTVESTFEDDMKNIVEEVAQETSGTAEATAKAADSLPKKTLGGRGKVAIGIGVATLVAGGIAISSSAIKKKKEQEQENHQQAHQQQYSYNNQMAIDNSYAMQMAQDISTYRYGKPMTGFVNH